ncbi:MAG: DNA primase, partial [Thermoplasmata archaeon]
ELEKLNKSELEENKKMESTVNNIQEEQKKEEIKEDKKKDDLLLDAFEKKVAFITDVNGNIIHTIQLNELFDKLSTTEITGNTLITGGIISQRLVDIAYEKGIGEIYGMKMLNVTKKPANMKIIIRNI